MGLSDKTFNLHNSREGKSELQLSHLAVDGFMTMMIHWLVDGLDAREKRWSLSTVETE